EYKRTLTLLGENTDEGREKFKHDLNETHLLFKSFVHKYRPELDIDSVATGEYWYGSDAVDKGLIDEVGVSDDWLISRIIDFVVL
ncbi:S49 family peptidase, partial [Proteus mirabilis]|nr:S49 family peptidase [Proteus mirabilis]